MATTPHPQCTTPRPDSAARCPACRGPVARSSLTGDEARAAVRFGAVQFGTCLWCARDWALLRDGCLVALSALAAVGAEAMRREDGRTIGARPERRTAAVWKEPVA